jgi:hypothetical protein
MVEWVKNITIRILLFSHNSSSFLWISAAAAVQYIWFVVAVAVGVAVGAAVAGLTAFGGVRETVTGGCSAGGHNTQCWSAAGC